MSNHKFAAADVHAATTTFAVLDDSGKFVMETVVETKAESLFDVLPIFVPRVMREINKGDSPRGSRWGEQSGRRSTESAGALIARRTRQGASHRAMNAV